MKESCFLDELQFLLEDFEINFSFVQVASVNPAFY